jgi:hypothetical protein
MIVRKIKYWRHVRLLKRMGRIYGFPRETVREAIKNAKG